MAQPNGETPTLANRPSNPVIITTEEDEEDEVTKKLTYANNENEVHPIENGVHSGTDKDERTAQNNNHHGEEQEVVAIAKSKSSDGEPIKTDIIPASPSQPTKKFNNSTLNNILNKSRSKVTKHTPSMDPDSTQHKKRGTGILASDADLAASPEEFAQGCTLLQLCAIGDLGKVVNYVTTSFANVNFRDYDRRTGLHVASSEGHLDVVKYLISKGARVNRTDRWGGSPLDDAHRHRHTDVARYLRSKGGRSGSVNLTTNLITAAAAGDIEGMCVITSSNFFTFANQESCIG